MEVKYKRKNKYVLTTADGKYAIVKMGKRCYHIKDIKNDKWGLGEYILDSNGDIATFFWLRTAKEYIESRFYKEVQND